MSESPQELHKEEIMRLVSIITSLMMMNSRVGTARTLNRQSGHAVVCLIRPAVPPYYLTDLTVER